MKPSTLEIFFTGKSFKIPSYQRDYAWVETNIDDLFEDVIEARYSKTPHYIGVFILSRKEEEDFYYIVDGQQRLTTLTMVLNAIIKRLNSKDDQVIYKNQFIYSGGKWRLELLGHNKDFFERLLQGKKVTPESKSQQLLLKAYEYIDAKVGAFHNQGSSILKDLLECIKSLEVMEFVERDEGKAIRIFQTVNDRGKPLSNMEKAKSLLIYYSNRFLGGKLDANINNNFGRIFECFNHIKELGENNGVSLITSKVFTEDSVMRYHFLAYDNGKYDFNATADYVLNVFLKLTLKDMVKDLQPGQDTAKLEEFIQKYVSDLVTFFEKFVDLLERVGKNKTYYKLFSILELSATLYPLVIRLHMRGLLDTQTPKNQKHNFIDLIEIADVRVYKTRGTDPVRDMSYLAKDTYKLTDAQIEDRLIGFIKDFMNDAEFTSRLEGDVYGNQALKHIFIEYSEQLRKKQYPLKDLVALNNTKPTIEHIFAQEVTYNFPSRGFNSNEEYVSKLHKLGNLSLLEKSLNSKCQNKPAEVKVSDPDLYNQSIFDVTKNVALAATVQGTVLCCDFVDQRTKNLVAYCMKRWAI